MTFVEVFYYMKKIEEVKQDIQAKDLAKKNAGNFCGSYSRVPFQQAYLACPIQSALPNSTGGQSGAIRQALIAKVQGNSYSQDNMPILMKFFYTYCVLENSKREFP